MFVQWTEGQITAQKGVRRGVRDLYLKKIKWFPWKQKSARDFQKQRRIAPRCHIDSFVLSFTRIERWFLVFNGFSASEFSLSIQHSRVPLLDKLCLRLCNHRMSLWRSKLHVSTSQFSFVFHELTVQYLIMIKLEQREIKDKAQRWTHRLGFKSFQNQRTSTVYHGTSWRIFMRVRRMANRVGKRAVWCSLDFKLYT